MTPSCRTLVGLIVATLLSTTWTADARSREQEASHLPHFCFVIRTYWGHGDEYGSGLWRLLKSLQRQEYARYMIVSHLLLLLLLLIMMMMMMMMMMMVPLFSVNV